MNTNYGFEIMRLTDDDEEPELVVAYGLYRVAFGPERIRVSRAWQIRRLPSPSPGWYEFRLTRAGEILAFEQIYLGEKLCQGNNNNVHRAAKFLVDSPKQSRLTMGSSYM